MNFYEIEFMLKHFVLKSYILKIKLHLKLMLEMKECLVSLTKV